MTGMELIIGGKVVGTVIAKVITLGGSFLGDNRDLHTNTKKLLKNLVEIQLPHIQSVIEEADNRQITNKGLVEWLDKLKDAVYEAEDVVDNFEAKRIRDSIKGKGKVSEIASSSAKMVKNLVFSDNDLKELKSVENNIDTLCNKDSIKISQIMNCDKKKKHSDSVGSETRSDMGTDAPIFGRDREIEFILDLMFNVLYGDFYHKADDPNFGEGSSRFWDILPKPVKSFSSLINPWLPKFIQTIKKGDTPEQSKKVKKGEATEQSEKVKKGDEPEHTKDKSTMITTREEPHFKSNHKLAVIPIFGVGGVGKTVVAKKIYNNESVREHFTLKAWVYVSENCDNKKILREILASFKPGFYLLMNLEYLGNMLKEIITNQRFLLILDNLRDMTELKWNDLKSLLSFGEVGSVVVVTTQSRSIANTIRTLPVVTLECLDTESFWELFEYFAFGGLKLGDLKDQPPLSPSKHDDLKKIGKQIADKLHGLPLTGEFIGTLLSKRLDREFWKDICRSSWWNIEGVRKNILPSIADGYNYLDPDLKQCFVFCSIFPKLYVFKRKRLVEMWIAQGFIQPNKEETYMLEKGEKRIEDIGEKRFGELVDRSFFQPTLRVGEYLMHDLVRDLAIAISSNEFCFVKSQDQHLPSLARHLGIDCDNLEVEWKCKDSTRLRTVILFGNWIKCSAESIGNIFVKYNRLRVLDVSYIELKTNEPINVASQLSHLRFVDLSFTGIKSIPDEFCALCHLEVLDVRGCYFNKLPARMNNLISLRHLYASPKTISLISGIGKLAKLQELEEFCIEDSERSVIKKGHKISELMHMNELSGHLVLSNLKAVSSKEEAVKSQLDKKIYLKSLTLRFNYYEMKPRTEVNMEVLDALKPARSLETLEVNGCRWESFPDWVFSPHHGFNNLKDISVKNYWLRSLPAFGELPFLELLCFDNLPFIEKVGTEFYGSSNVVFPSLKELRFHMMDSWTHWSNVEVRKKIFPRLKELRLEYCNALKELPTDSSISSVVELNLVGCDDLCNIGEVLQGMPSLSHLIITEVDIKCLSIYCTPLNSLEVMHLEGIKKLCLVEGLKSLVNLRMLVIVDFNEILESYEVEQENDEISQQDNEEQCLQFLTYLHLRHKYSSTQNLPRVGRLSSLCMLLIECSPAVQYTEDEESWFIQLTSLEKLAFRFCRLEHLPSTLPLLTSLKKLHIYNCPHMLSLPENGLPKNLAELYIDGCLDLIRRCQPTEGDDWHKISHIPFVRLDGNTHLQSSSSVLSFEVKGTGHWKVDNLIALQMRASFFDRNNDGIIYKKETYQGLQTIGVSVPVAIVGSLFINGALSPLTRPPRTISSPCLPIYIENICMGKHDSDTDAYDSEGRFVPEKFEQIFTNSAKTNPNALTPQELEDMIQVNQDPGDTKGRIGSRSEW